MYDWTIVDRIFDTYRDAGVKPLVEIGFMPEAMSTHPEPYRHDFPKGSIFTGWAYPPKDYRKWAELVFQFAKHLRERYGDAEVKTWLWEVWNEPDIEYWKGTPEEYFELYDFSVDAVLRAVPGAVSAGPTAPGRDHPRRSHSCAASWSIALAARISPPARRARRSTSSVFIPKERRSGSAITCRWESRDN